MIELPDYLKPLETVVRPFPRSAVEEAVARREETVPYLLEALEWTLANAEEVPGDYLLHEYALRLLAQFRETRAYEPVLRLARNPLADELLEDTITMSLGPILASVSGGDSGPIRELIEDRDVDEFVRAAGLQALGILCRSGQLSRQEFSDYLGELFSGKLQDKDSFVWTALADVCVVFGMAEHRALLLAALDRGLVDPFFDDWKEAEKRLASGAFQESLDFYYRQIDDAAECMCDWFCFKAEAERELGDDGMFADDEISDGDEVFDDVPAWEEALDELVGLPAAEPVRAELKPGRNDPCVCGSGKKYKRCCG